LRQRLEHAITETDFDLAALNNEQFLCRVTLPEDDIANLEVARGNAENQPADSPYLHSGL